VTDVLSLQVGFSYLLYSAKSRLNLVKGIESLELALALPLLPQTVYERASIQV